MRQKREKNKAKHKKIIKLITDKWSKLANINIETRDNFDTVQTEHCLENNNLFDSKKKPKINFKMLRTAFIVLIGVVCVAVAQSEEVYELDSEIGSEINFVAASGIEQFLEEHPRMKLLQELSREETYGQIKYTYGRRISGDRLVGSNAQSQQWSSPQDVTLRLNYPTNGYGAVVSFLQILVDQVTQLTIFFFDFR